MVKELEKDIEEDIAQESVKESERQEEFARKDATWKDSVFVLEEEYVPEESDATTKPFMVDISMLEDHIIKM